jgi:hypothetical protein
MRSAALSLVAAMLLSSAACAAPVVFDAYFRPDLPYPEFAKYWGFQRGGDFLSKGDIGGTVQVYVRNAGAEPITMRDVALDGVSLSKAIPFLETRRYRRYVFPANLHFSTLPKEQIDKVIAAGEPVWWRFEPKTLKPGEIGELVLRVRRRPVAETVNVLVSFGKGQSAEAQIAVGRAVPRLEAICFAPGRDTVYLYAKHPVPGTKPDKVLMDGADITSCAVIASDSNASVTPIVCKLSKPVALASLHCFQVCYPNSDKVTASVRAYDGEFAYGMWGAANGEADQVDIAKAYLRGLADHNVTVQMEQIGSEAVADFMKTTEGLKLLESLGIRRMIYEPGKGNITNPWAFFLMDEPDAGDSKIEGLPPGTQIGSLGQGLIQRAAELRESDPTVPGLLNIDYTYPPDNWYTYGQIPDILTADPYYQGHIARETEWGKNPEKLSLFKKATYINGVAEICRSSQAPRQTNMLLFTGRPDNQTDNIQLRYATPQEKRIEVYYCIGAGIKGISYWWYHCLEDGLLPATADPVAQAQWKEIGLLGAELRTAGPVIMTSCPVTLPTKAPSGLWVRALLRGSDTIVLICVNDAYTCDLKGINIKPMKNVEVQVSLPKWLEPKSVFEVTYKGTRDVPTMFLIGSTQPSLGVQVAGLHLGDVDVTRLIFITSDSGLKDRLQKLYGEKFAENVKKLLAEMK